MITEDEAMRALEWMRDNSDKAAAARATRIYMEEYRKSVKSKCMEKYQGSIAAKEASAYADEDYILHLDAIRTAVHEDEKYRFLMRSAEAKVEAWRTLQATRRAEARI